MPKRRAAVLSEPRSSDDPTYKRLTVNLTTPALDLLMPECEHRRAKEGAKVASARIINELIVAHLKDHANGTGPPGKVLSPAAARKSRRSK